MTLCGGAVKSCWGCPARAWSMYARHIGAASVPPYICGYRCPAITAPLTDMLPLGTPIHTAVDSCGV